MNGYLALLIVLGIIAAVWLVSRWIVRRRRCGAPLCPNCGRHR